MKILLKQGNLVTGSGQNIADLLIEDGKIIKIANSIEVSADKEIDCEGKLIFSGMIDTHVHFRTPGITHKADTETESKAAVAGGVTTIFDMPNTNPATTTTKFLKEKQEIFANTCLTNFGLMIGASKNNLDELKKADEDDTIPAIKIFMAESTGEMTLFQEEYLIPIFKETKKIIAAHAEDEQLRLERLQRYAEGMLPEAIGIPENDPFLHSIIRNNEVTSLGTKSAVDLALKFNHNLHILHASTKQELPYIEKGITEKLVSAETCPHYLWFNREDIKRPGGFFLVMNPALKGPEDNIALWEAINSGIISQITTDHAPHLLEEKKLPYGQGKPAGLPGVQFVLHLMLDAVRKGKLTLETLARLISENPAENFKIKNKGYLREGYDADIVIVDPLPVLEIKNANVLSKCAWTPYDGFTLSGGRVEKTFVNGNLVFDQGEIFDLHKGKNISIKVTL